MLIKIFVSSLFKEMAAERDVLHRQVSAMLADKLGDRDITFDFIDLRWGVDDTDIEGEAQRSRFIVERCFDAIDDCDIFLSVIGKEYGSIADGNICRELLPELDANREYSFTDMELEYAKLHFPKERMLLLHTPDSDGDDPEIRRIKRELVAQYPHAEYRREDGLLSPSFIAGAVELLCNAIGTINEREPRKQEFFLRKKPLLDCLMFMNFDKFIMLQGGSGSGKSVLLRILAERLTADDGLSVHSIFELGDAAKRSIPSILSSMFPLEGSYREILEGFVRIVVDSPKRTVIILDDIDGFDIQDIYMLYEALYELPVEKLCILFSSARKDHCEYFADLKVQPLKVGDLSPEEARDYLVFLSDRYKKQYYWEIIDYIVNKGEHYLNPLYLSLLMDRLMTMDMTKYQSAREHGAYTEGIIAEMKKLVDSCPPHTEEIITWYLKDLDSYVHPEYTAFLFTAMSVYSEPLPVPVLKRVYEDMFSTEWSELAYYTYRFYLRQLCEVRNDRLIFKHDIIRRLAHERVVDEDDKLGYYRSFKNVLSSSYPSELTMRYYFSALLGEDEATEALRSPSTAAAASEALIMTAYSGLIGNRHANVLIAFRALLIKGMYKEAVELFDRLAESIPIRGMLASTANLFRSVDELLTKSDMPVMLKLRALYRMMSFVNYSGLEKYFRDLPNRFSALLSEVPTSEIEESSELLLDCSYYATKLCRATDREADFTAMLTLTVEFLTLCPTIPFFAPSVIEMLTRTDIERAEALCLSLLEKYRSSARTESEKRVVGNLCYRLHSIYLNKGDIANADRYALESYHAFTSAGEWEQLPSTARYDYTLGLSAYGFHCSVNHLEKEEAETYKELYSLRNHMAKTEPDNYTVLVALTNTVLSMLSRGIKTDMPEELLLNSLISRLFTYARRGNARVGWLFAHFFKDVLGCVEDSEILMIVLDNFKELDLMLCPIIEDNSMNSSNLLELVHVYLDIYAAYCQARLLPLEDGKALLRRLAEAGRAAVRAEPCKDTYDVYFRVYMEIQAVLLQQSDKIMFMQSDIYLENSAFLKECLELPESEDRDIFLTLAPASEALVYVYLYQDIENSDPEKRMMFKMLLDSVGIDVFGEVRKCVSRIFESVKSYPGCRHEVISILILGLQFLEHHGADLSEPEFQTILNYLRQR